MNSLCRTCLRSPQKLLIIFDDPQLPEKIEAISSVQVSLYDNLPTTICVECIKNINTLYNFRKIIINSNLELQQRYAIVKSEPLDSFKSSDDENDTTNVSEPDGVDTSHFVDINAVEEPIVKQEDLEIITKTTAKDPLYRKRCSLKKKIIYHKQSYNCQQCSFSCTEYSKWKYHKRTHNYVPTGICNVCGKSIRLDNLKKHIKSHSEPPIACPECGKMFKNSESLRTHRMFHFAEKSSCKLCGKVYTYRGEQYRHMKRHVSPAAKTIKCSLCEKMFRDITGMRKHLRSHTGERPYLCSYCQKGFSSSNALKTHIRQHTKERPYICEYCPMAFPQKVSLRTHIKSKHSTANEDSL